MSRLHVAVYDAGILIAAEAGDIRVWRAHRAYLTAGGVPQAPAALVAQVWRNGSRQARLAQFLHGCEIVPLDGETAREVGRLLGDAGTADTVDGAVCVLAARTGAVVSTSDPDDIQHLLDHLGERGKRVLIQRV